MSISNKESDGIPFIIFIPVFICIAAILFLLDYRQRQLNTAHNDLAHVHTEVEEELLAEEIQPLEEESDENDAGEGSSTAVRIRKVGKKRGEKLRRKEEMRQYREYMDQQRELRRAQEEIYEAEFSRRKLEESIKRADEQEKRKKERKKKAKANEKEELKRQKEEEKQVKKRQARFEKYNGKIKKLVQEKKLVKMNELSKLIGLTEEEVVEILKKLCDMDNEFELCLWSGTDTFLFITQQDYNQLEQKLYEKGKMSIHEFKLSLK